MITFLTAVYNEQDEIVDLLRSVSPFVDNYAIVDDGSTDTTAHLLQSFFSGFEDESNFKTIDHTGLPETVKNEALSLVADGSWVLMLDADERLDTNTLIDIQNWVKSADDSIDYVYLKQVEVIDDVPVREFQKCKLFRKESVRFPLNNIHADDQFVGNGTYKPDWVVVHRKTSTKQIVRETEYLQTYKKLLDEGKIDEGRYQWLVNLHHYVRPHG